MAQTILCGIHKSAAWALHAEEQRFLLTLNQVPRKNGGSLRKLAHDSMYRPGIDLAVVVAILSAITDIAAIFLPWLAGINASYVPGRGLTFTVTVLLSAIDLLAYNPYLGLIFLPPVLTITLVIFSLRPEGILPPRIGYKAKSRILLFVSALISILPAYAFLQNALLGFPTTPETAQFVTSWELGGAATMPIYAGFGFVLALGLKLIKD